MARRHVLDEAANGQVGRAPADYDVVIVGAGPVGLLLACLLGQEGKRVRMLEKRAAGGRHSQAIGITPPSLQIVDRLGMRNDFITHGQPIEKVHVHGQSGFLGTCDFTHLDGPDRYVLALPQHLTMQLLRAKLETLENVTLSHEVELKGLEQSEEYVVLRAVSPAGPLTLTTAHAVACDGSRGGMRDMLNIAVKEGAYRCHFAMADFADTSALGREAHLYFTADGAVESFPLPNNLRRWIVQTERFEADVQREMIASLVARRTGLALSCSEPMDSPASPFTPRWLQCETYSEGRVFLCGDAAHVMSPIGGQGMNTGFADAEFLCTALVALQADHSTAPAWSLAYDQLRKRAAATAIRRAEWGMGLGTWRGKPASVLRDLIMRYGMFSPLFSHTVASWFSMMSIPNRTLDQVPQHKLPVIPSLVS